MKKFEKPVVVLNEMLMNESIATDCCYDMVQDGLVTTLKAFNGGTIGSSKTYSLYSDVIKLLGGYATTPSNHYKLYIPKVKSNPGYSYSVGAVPDLTGGGFDEKWIIRFDQFNTPGDVANVWYLQDGKGVQATGNNISTDLADWNASAYVQLRKSGCTHTPGSGCPWLKETTLDNAHIGAQFPHALGMPDWAAPHVAGRYNS